VGLEVELEADEMAPAGGPWEVERVAAVPLAADGGVAPVEAPAQAQLVEVSWVW